MTYAEQASIHCHVHDVWEDCQRLADNLNMTIACPGNPFNGRTHREFHIAWRTEWRRVVAEHKAACAPNDADLSDLGVKN